MHHEEAVLFLDNVVDEDLPPVVLEKPLEVHGQKILYDGEPVLSRNLAYDITNKEDYYASMSEKSRQSF